MKAVVYKGPYSVAVEEVPEPGIQAPNELPLEAAPDAYDKFDKRVDGYTRVILHPAA